MKINRVTFTGADDNTSIEEMVKISEKFPFVEWGILYARDPGRERYPSYKWVAELAEAKIPMLSAHLCGQFSRDIMQKGSEVFFTDPLYCAGIYKRVQLNFNFSNTPFMPSELWKVVENQWAYSFILQFNKSNSEVINELLASMVFENIHVLHDASGGRGKEISTIPEPFDVYTGYSGGLKPENIEEVAKKVSEIQVSVIQTPLVGPIETKAWLDMESGVRTDNQFDLNKVKDVCEKVVKYIQY